MANGFKVYFKNMVGFNMMDGVIVLVGLVEEVVTGILLWPSADIVNGPGITAARALRLLRALKLARYWYRFELLIETLGKTLQGIKAFSVLMIVFLYISTILGQEFFAFGAKVNSSTGKIDMENGTAPLFNFDGFLNSFFTVFIIQTTDMQAYVFN